MAAWKSFLACYDSGCWCSFLAALQTGLLPSLLRATEAPPPLCCAQTQKRHQRDQSCQESDGKRGRAENERREAITSEQRKEIGKSCSARQEKSIGSEGEGEQWERRWRLPDRREVSCPARALQALAARGPGAAAGGRKPWEGRAGAGQDRGNTFGVWECLAGSLSGTKSRVRVLELCPDNSCSSGECLFKLVLTGQDTALFSALCR